MKCLALIVPVLLLPRLAFAQASAAEALWQEGRAALARGDLEVACARLAASDRLEPAPGTKANLGECEEKRGRIASAWAAYRTALDMIPSNDPRVAPLRARIGRLVPLLPKLVLRLTPDAPRGTTVLEGESVLGDDTTFGVPLPLDPGEHRLVVRAPGREPASLLVSLVERRTTEIIVSPSPERKSAPPPGPERDRVAPPVRPDRPSLSHHLQVGAMMRLDIDGIRAGVVAAPGLTFGLGDHIELVGTALLGKSKGGEIGAQAFILTGAWKPLVYLGLPLFAIEGARPGIHAAGGIQWDPVRNFGAFAMVGATAMLTVPTGYQQVTFLPSFGVQGRL